MGKASLPFLSVIQRRPKSREAERGRKREREREEAGGKEDRRREGGSAS